jgi:hypothetical protein
MTQFIRVLARSDQLYVSCKTAPNTQHSFIENAGEITQQMRQSSYTVFKSKLLPIKGKR